MPARNTSPASSGIPEGGAECFSRAVIRPFVRSGSNGSMNAGTGPEIGIPWNWGKTKFGLPVFKPDGRCYTGAVMNSHALHAAAIEPDFHRFGTTGDIHRDARKWGPFRESSRSRRVNYLGQIN